MPTELADDKKREPLGKAIADEVRKDQGETPTFPFSEDEIVKEPPDDPPPAREPPTDNDVGSGPIPSDDIREPRPDPKKIA